MARVNPELGRQPTGGRLNVEEDSLLVLPGLVRDQRIIDMLSPLCEWAEVHPSWIVSNGIQPHWQGGVRRLCHMEDKGDILPERWPDRPKAEAHMEGVRARDGLQRVHAGLYQEECLQVSPCAQDSLLICFRSASGLAYPAQLCHNSRELPHDGGCMVATFNGR